MSYVYILSEPGLWTVGFYDQRGEWHPDSDHGDREDAAKRVHYLNVGGVNSSLDEALNSGDGTYRP